MISHSQAIFTRAQKVLPGGVSRNTVYRSPHPLYAAYGKGCYVTDVDGVERIDFSNNVASLIHGHAHPAVVQAVCAQLQRGSAFGVATEVEVRFAEHLCDRVSAFEKIRFVNSGSEAIMAAVKAARAFTGRPMMAKVEGAYHGAYDYAEVSQNAAPPGWGPADHPSSMPLVAGTPPAVLQDVVVIPYNQPEVALRLLDAHADQIACILLDLLPHRLGFIRATPEFVSAIYQWTRRNGALLVFDEVITLRCRYGGAQHDYAEPPDLTAMGKIIGGGFPVGAFAGRADVMSVMDPTSHAMRMPHSGTFSANATTMTAGLTAMERYDRPAVERLNRLGDMARSQLQQAISAAGVAACVTGQGSMFRILLKPAPPGDYRSAYGDARETQALKALLDCLLDQGVMLINSAAGTLSTPMTEKEIARLAEAVERALRTIRPWLE